MTVSSFLLFFVVNKNNVFSIVEHLVAAASVDLTGIHYSILNL